MNKGGRSDCERATEFDERWAEDATAVIIWKHDIKGPWTMGGAVAAMIMVVVVRWSVDLWVRVCACGTLNSTHCLAGRDRGGTLNSTHFLAGRDSTPDLLPRG